MIVTDGTSGDAELMLRQAIGRAPESVQAHADLCALLCKRHRGEEAIALLDDVLARQPGTLWALSLKAAVLDAGRRTDGGSLSVTPQAQIVYSNVRFDAFVDPNDAAVSSADGDSLRGRLGLSLDHQRSWQQADGDTARTHFYGFANLEYEMLDGQRADVSETPILRRDDRLWGELGVGGSYSWDDGRFAIFSEISANTALANFGDSNGLRANAGFRMRF